MAQLGDRLGFVAEAGNRVRVGRDRLEHLDRAGPFQVGVVYAVDQAHCALAYEVLDLVLAQPGSGRDRHGPDYAGR